MKWFKFYGQDWLTDMKVMKMSVEDRLCFITLMCLAASEENGGVIKNCDEDAIIRLTQLHDNPYNDDNEYNRARGCLKRYEALQIVTLARNGDVTLVNFMHRQAQNLSNAERQKKYRNSRKINTKQRNDSNAAQSNDSNARLEKTRIEKNKSLAYDGFNNFWGVYPNKKSKKTAEKAWNKILPSRDLQQNIISALELQKRSEQWTRDGGRYVPYAATWLNGERWKDEVDAKPINNFLYKN